jgi:hypothetical protein
MDSSPLDERGKKVGGQLFEELFFEFIEKKYGISKKDLLKTLEDKKDITDSIPVSILRTDKLSSLEAIVKFLRENRKFSYNIIGKLLQRNPKTLAVTYSVAHQKMSKPFSTDVDSDTERIPFDAFSKDLSILESICAYLKSKNNSYAIIARMLNKDQRTVWTVCKRAEKKSGQKTNTRKEDDYII